MLQQNICYHRYGLKGLAQGGKAEKGVLRARVAREQWPRTFSWPCPVGDSREGGAQSWETKVLQAGGWEERKSFIGDPQVLTKPSSRMEARAAAELVRGPHAGRCWACWSDLKTDRQPAPQKAQLLIQCPWSCGSPSSIPERILSNTWFFSF